MSWDLSIYRLQLSSLFLSNSCECPFCMVGAVFLAVLFLVRRAGSLSGPPQQLWGPSGVRSTPGCTPGHPRSSWGGLGHWLVDPYVLE
jgi:hypothetical protein